ncbi:hypothetical protein [Streptomyces aureus]|uniref:hypothetical protein n=1 Tax=Streptomyces aureus TaxID=193461 RepID=UPI003408B3B3
MGWAIGYEQYLLSVTFGVPFTALADPGGRYGRRAFDTSLFAPIGAGATAPAFGIAADAWGRKGSPGRQT